MDSPLQPPAGFPATIHTAWERLAPYRLILALLFIGGTLALLNPHFLAPANLVNVLRQVSINGVLAVGVTLVLLTGGVDLSLGSVAALAGVVAAHLAHPGEHFVLVPVFAGIGVGAACGILNGTLVTKGAVAPFIATLGLMTATRGLALIASNGRPISNLSPEFTGLASASCLGMPGPVLIFAVVALVAGIFLRHMKYGRYIYAVGGNEQAARVSGLNVAGIKIMAYTACGAAAGLAGVVLASRVTAGQPNAAVGYELDAIAAAVIGGTRLTGGVGLITGTVLGAVLIGVINNGLDLLNVSSYYQQIVKGAIIVGAVCLKRSPTR